MIGIISSRFEGIVSPGRRYLLISTNSKLRLSLSTAEESIEVLSLPPQTNIGVLHLLFEDAVASLGSGAPILTTPPSSVAFWS